MDNFFWSEPAANWPLYARVYRKISTRKMITCFPGSLSLFWWNAVNWSRVVISEQSLRPCAWHSGQPVQHIWRNVLAVITLAWHGPLIRMDFCLTAVFFWRNVIWCIQAKESVQTRLYGKPLWRAGCQLNRSKSTISWTGIARAIRTRNKNLIEV